MALYTHTHTHTHTDELFNGQKIRVAVVVLIVIICSAVVFFTNKNRIIKMPMVLGTIGRNRIGEGTEPGSGAFSLGSNDTVGASIDTSKWDLNRVNIVYDTENTPVPVPKGFTASGAEGEHTVNTGFVIYEGEEEVNDENAWDESCTRNQFVWIPVYDTSRVYEVDENGKKKGKLWEYTAAGRTAISNNDTDNRREPGILPFDNKQFFARYGMQGYTKEKLYQELSTSFDKDMDSIEKYGGFYIGRYETGNISYQQQVLVRLNDNISERVREKIWFKMFLNARNISSNENIEVNIIWGCLWDEMLQWLVDTDCKTPEEIGSDSESWGNYDSTTFEYIDKYLGTTTKNSSKIIPTGSTERNKANNIYDLAGNAFDLTLEGNGNSARYSRGGSFSAHRLAKKPAGNRYYTGFSEGQYGMRTQFVIY